VAPPSVTAAHKNLCHCVPILLALAEGPRYHARGCWNGIMVRIVQAISILALGAAGLTFCRCFGGAAGDEPVQTPSAVERFQQSRTGKSDEGERLPPLLQEAQTLALYLNPPRAAPVASVPISKSETATPPLPVKTVSAVTPAVPVRPPASAPKFELHGISYYRQKPEQSIALVLEPGGTRRWVHPGDQLGHLTIERIDANSVLCRDGEQTQVVALAQSEALTKYAQGVKGGKTMAALPQIPKNESGPPAAPQAQQRESGPEVPPPAPGIRQMPPSRVAALLGRPS
jgi:hypothetical protein